MSTQSILYEQPVNELMRACLRLEHLFQQAHQGLRGASVFDTHMAMNALANILTLIERPDLRSKFVKEFVRHHANLSRFINSEHIDQTKLKEALKELDDTIQNLQTSNGRFCPELRDNEFLMGIRQYLNVPGGACSFDTPGYHHWLQQTANEKHAVLAEWLHYFASLAEAINLLLRLIRQSGHAQLHTAHAGFYQASLDPQTPCQLIRVSVPNSINAFPEISVGRHGVSIRFYHPTLKERAKLYEQDIAFKLSCCIL